MTAFPLRAFVLTLLLGSASPAQESGSPQPAPLPPAIAAPQDVPYPGMLRLSVDATDLDRRIFQVHESIPVASPGPLTLLYPQWLPGNHASSGPIDQLAGLLITAAGRHLEWTRDPIDVFAFHLDVPPVPNKSTWNFSSSPRSKAKWAASS